MTLIELWLMYRLVKWLNDLEKNQITIAHNQQELVRLIRLQHSRSQNYIVDMVLLGLQPDDDDESDDEESPPEYSETDTSGHTSDEEPEECDRCGHPDVLDCTSNGCHRVALWNNDD